MAKAAPAAVKKEIENVREKLRRHEYLYYVQDRRSRMRRTTG
jgi:NAD-dependent DNA ligase